MDKVWCCEDMQAECEAYLDCDFKGENHTPFNCEYTRIYRSDDHHAYGLILHDKGNERGGITKINFCPFCGMKLARVE